MTEPRSASNQPDSTPHDPTEAGDAGGGEHAQDHTVSELPATADSSGDEPASVGSFVAGLIGLALTAVALVLATDFPADARGAPLIVGIPSALLFAAIAVREGGRILRAHREGGLTIGGGDLASRLGGVAGSMAWLLTYFALLVTLGTLLSAGVFALGFVLSRGERWYFALVVALALPGTLYLVFERVLRVQMYSGMLDLL